MDSPLVSLILLSINSGRSVGQTIQSVLDQSYSNWELIIVDDGSTDNSAEVIRSFTDPRITAIFNETNRGTGQTYNQAYSLCTGKYTGKIVAGDWFAPEKLARQVDYLETHPETGLVGTFIFEMDGTGQVLEGDLSEWFNRERDLNLVENWVVQDSLCHSSVLLRKDLHDRVGGLDPDLLLTPEYDLWLRCLLNGFRFHVIPEKLTCFYRSHPSDVSNNPTQYDLFFELAYLFCKRLAGYFQATGRSDLFIKSYNYFRLTFFVEVPPFLLARLYQKLSNFPLYPPDFRSFMADFGADWNLQLASLKEQPLKWPGPQKVLDVPPVRTPALNLETRGGLAIYDDYFPNVLSAFRVAEFNYYLANLDCAILSAQPDFDALKEEYLSFYPQNRDRIKRFVAETPLNYRLLYMVFLKNAFNLLPLIEREEIPFIFTLYPGAEFLFHDIVTDYRLLRLTNSKFLKKMIVTQKTTYNYLLQNGLCPPEKIEYIYGAVIPAEFYSRFSIPHRYYGQDKPTFDICFVAMKYMVAGRDKGYDVFIEVAKVLARLSPLFRFHVVGGFGAPDIDVTDLGDRITFYGHQPTQFFPEFYAGMDIIISPNVPFLLMSGTFDGFPTGACSEAALCGVAVFCTDFLNENEEFTPGVDICIIPGEVEGIVEKVVPYFNEPAALHRLAETGQRRFREIYSTERQLVPRLDLFKKYLG